MCGGTYQSKYGYLMLWEEEDHPPLEWWMRHVWALNFPLEKKLFLWLAMVGKDLFGNILQNYIWWAQEDDPYVAWKVNISIICSSDAPIWMRCVDILNLSPIFILFRKGAVSKMFF